MADKSFEVGDLVWAKMKGYPPWPGKISDFPAQQKSKPKKYHYFVFFFGSKNFAWIHRKNIELHSNKQVEKYGNRKIALHHSAVQTIIECSKGVSKYQSDECPLMNVLDKKYSGKNQVDDHDKFSNKVAKSKKKGKVNTPPPKRIRPARKHTHSSDQSNHATGHSLQTISDHRADDNSIESTSNVPAILAVPASLGYPTEGFALPKLNVLERKYYERPNTPPIDVLYRSEILKLKDIKPTKKKIGFLGFEKLGQGMIKNLCQSGHSLILWNQTQDEYKNFVTFFKDNIQIVATPADVVENADITFSCVSDGETAKQVVFGNCGILKELEKHNGEGKGYVEMTSMDPKISIDIGTNIKNKGARYLEASLCGSRIDAIEGTLLIVTAGDETLYEECESCFDAFSKRHRFIDSEVGAAYNLGVVRNMLLATIYAALAESLALVSRTGLKGEDFVNILRENVFLSTESLVERATAMLENKCTSNTTMQTVQKNLNLGLLLADKMAQPTPIFAAVNESVKFNKIW